MWKSRHSRRNVPPKRSQNEFAVGALTGVRNTHTPMTVTPVQFLRENAVAVVNDELIRMTARERLLVLPNSTRSVFVHK